MNAADTLADEARGRLDALMEAVRRLEQAVTDRADAEAVQDAACWLRMAKTALDDVGQPPPSE